MENAKRLSNEDVLAKLPELKEIAEVEDIPFRKLPSNALIDRDLLELGSTIQQLFDDGRADGVVVTHGTNTIEESALFLHLTLKTDRPVVLVGAMRPSTGLSTDGDLNLLNAIAVSASPSSTGKGVLVVLNDTIHSGRDVTKTSTYRVQSFQSRDLGPLGYADTDRRIVWYHQPVRPHTLATEFDIRVIGLLPRVDVVVSYIGADGHMIDAAVMAGAQGIISAGTGAGRPTPAEDEALAKAHDMGVVICIGSRVGSGRVMRSPGFARRGFVACDNLVPWKARVLLALALTITHEPDEIQRMFDLY